MDESYRAMFGWYHNSVRFSNSIDKSESEFEKELE